MTSNQQQPSLTPPRTVPTRDEKYMGMAFWAASFSKDPNTQMGAIIIAQDNTPLGWGYNGPPKKFIDRQLNWARPDPAKPSQSLSKYDFMLHAEENAIDHSLSDLTDSTLYVTGKPCKRCMLKICSREIRSVIYFPYVPKDPNSTFASGKHEACEVSTVTDELARLGNVSLRKFDGNLNWMRDRIKVMESMGVFDQTSSRP